MKILKLITLLAVGLLVSSCTTQTSADRAQLSTVVRLFGQARYSADGGKTWKMIKPGDFLESGCVIQTAERSGLFLMLGERLYTLPPHGGLYNPETHPSNLLGLGRSSMLEILNPAAAQIPDSGIRRQPVVLICRAGEVVGHVKASTGKALYEIRTSTNTIVRLEGGSVYSLRASGALTIFQGKAVVTTTHQDKPVELSAWQTFDPVVGSVTNIPARPPGWEHDLWLPSDPWLENWSEPPPMKNLNEPVLPRRKF